MAQIADAVAADDDAPFRRVSGIGPKTAKLIVVQLAGKIQAPRVGAPTRGGSSAAVSAQVVQALDRARLVGARSRARRSSPSWRTPARRTASSVPALLRLTLAALGPARKETVGG